MEGLLARLQHASLGKQELFDLLMNLDLTTLETAQVPVTKEEKIYNEDATLMETIVIHPMSGLKEPLMEPQKPVAEPKELVVEPAETIEQIIFYPEVGTRLPTILCPSVTAPLPPIPSLNQEPQEKGQVQEHEQEQEQEQEQVVQPIQEQVSVPPPTSPSNIMESLFNLKRTTTEEKTGPLYTCEVCHRVFKRPHLLSQHHEISLACSQRLTREIRPAKGIHQLVHDCLNRASRGEEEDKNECVYCHSPFTTKESQRAHFQGSASCNRQALDAFKQMILAL